MHSFSARTRGNKEVIANTFKTKNSPAFCARLINTRYIDKAIISLRTVEAFGKYACGIFSAETAAAVLRGPAGAKR